MAHRWAYGAKAQYIAFSVVVAAGHFFGAQEKLTRCDQHDHFDVIVMEQSGGTTAPSNCKAGVNTLLIEKHKLPRHKTCGVRLTTGGEGSTFLISLQLLTAKTTFLTIKCSPSSVHSPNPGFMVRRAVRYLVDDKSVDPAHNLG